MPKLSIIVPVFNGEKYLDECLSSISAQSFTDVEVICINDGSTDKTNIILSDWIAKNPTIRVFNEENGCVSFARNIGLCHALGDYIAFVDADDTVEPDMFEALVSRAERDQADVVGCGFNTFPPKAAHSFSFTTDGVIDFHTLLRLNPRLFSSNDLCFVWRYIYRRSLLVKNHIQFLENLHFGEDGIFVTDALAAAQRIVLLNQTYYNYRKDNRESLTSRLNPEIINILPLVWQVKQEQIRRFDMDHYSPCSRDLAGYTLRILLFMLLNNIVNPTVNNVSDILSLDLIRNSCETLGLRNPYDTWKEYLFFLAVKYRLARIAFLLYFGWRR